MGSQSTCACSSTAAADLDALGGGGDIHGPDVGQLQGGRQVDRQRPVVGLGNRGQRGDLG